MSEMKYRELEPGRDVLQSGDFVKERGHLSLIREASIGEDVCIPGAFFRPINPPSQLTEGEKENLVGNLVDDWSTMHDPALPDAARNSLETYIREFVSGQLSELKAEKKIAVDCGLKLADERDSLRARVAVLDTEFTALARRILESEPREGAWENHCHLCGVRVEAGEIPHRPDCPIVLSRAALKGEG